jgi:hypothetical protein
MGVGTGENVLVSCFIIATTTRIWGTSRTDQTFGRED